MTAAPSWLAERGRGRYVGILLAAGFGTRFDPSGLRNKLLQPLADGTPVAVAAATRLHQAIAELLAVVRPGSESLALRLREAGCAVSVCASSDKGMAASLVHAIETTRDARGWIIALGDMPHVQPGTPNALLEALKQGARIAAPAFGGRRGNPVAFAASLLPELLALSGDEGARSLLRRHAYVTVDVDDPGIMMDIDTAADLQSPPQA